MIQRGDSNLIREIDKSARTMEWIAIIARGANKPIAPSESNARRWTPRYVPWGSPNVFKGNQNRAHHLE